jgi:hypothetical protein
MLQVLHQETQGFLLGAHPHHTHNMGVSELGQDLNLTFEPTPSKVEFGTIEASR